MNQKSRKTDPAGTTDQLPRWEGPEESRPSGYLPAKDDPETDRDANGETLKDIGRGNPTGGAGKRPHDQR